jgi:hypothetical protein
MGEYVYNIIMHISNPRNYKTQNVNTNSKSSTNGKEIYQLPG